MKNRVISSHLMSEPRIIEDLPGQVFIPGMAPDPEPVQAELFKPVSDIWNDTRCGNCGGGPCFNTDREGDYDHCSAR